MVTQVKLLNAEGFQNHGPQLGNEVINLSNHNLSAAETSLLKRGLQFVPAPTKTSTIPLLQAASHFGRNLKLKQFFGERRWLHKEKEPFTAKSNWVPPDHTISPEIHAAITTTSEQIKGLQCITPRQNLSTNEKHSIEKLKSNRNIIIQKADKGSATVIMNKSDYLLENYRQLSNTNNYEKLNEFIQPKTASKILQILSKMKKESIISEKQFNYLKPPDNPRPRRFYTLPKIHKPIESWTVPSKVPPGRPIISNCNSETEKIAIFIDKFLKQKSTLHPSYIKDTHDFVNKIREIRIPENALLITLDVESMYTNINNEDGISAFQETFSDKTNHPYYPFIKELLELSLNNNDFEFNGDIFLQKSGVSMGIRFAPSFADIFMAKWEKEALDKYPLRPLLYLRYLDDIFIIWTHSKQQFYEFLEVLNSHHPSIRLKDTVSDTSVDFLDTTVFKYIHDKNMLCIKVYFKPTDTHALLHKDSFHPKATFSGIIKSQILRFSKICTLTND